MTVLAGRYRLDRVLGEGGLATVWAATDAELARPVAVKRLKPEAAAQPGLVRRLRREARAMAALDHPHIIKALAVAEDAQGVPFLVLERAEGPTLGVWGQQRRRLSDRVTCLEQILSALAHVHARGVVHRDLNPANVLVGRSPDGGPRVQILDFGFAGLAGEREGGPPAVFGAPAYMSPEQAAGERHLGPATDLYAVAAIAWELFTGQPPFAATTATAVLMQQLTAPLPALRPLPGLELPEGLYPWLASGLAKAPSKRPASAGEMRRSLLELTRSAAPSPDQAPPAGFPAADESSGSLSYAVLSEAADAERMPLVGRDADRQWLWGAVRATCADGHGRCLVLEGPSGVGATRLGDWLVGAVAQGGWLQTGRSRWLAGPVPGGLVEALRPLLWTGEDAPSERGAVRDWLARGRGPVPHRALAAAVRAAAARLPVLLFLDGFDQAGEAEQEALARLVAATARPDCPVVYLVTVRREAEAEGTASPVDPLLAGPSEVALRRLEGLGRGELELLAQQILLLHPDAARAVARAAAGRPLHAVMALAALKAEGALARVDGLYRLRQPAALPSSLGDIASRWLVSAFAKRPDGARLRDLAERLAVLGQGAPYDLAVALGRSAGWAAEAVERGIDRLVRLGVLEDARGDAFVLRHPVLWRALRRQSTARTDAATLHLQAAEAHRLRSGPLTGDEAAAVAAHFRAAGQVRQAVEALLEAGQRARRAGALTRASARFARALRWLDQAVDGPHAGLRAEALLGRAEVALARRSVDDARRLGHALRGLRAAEPAAATDGAWVLARAALLEGRPQEALQRLDDALRGLAEVEPRRKGRLSLTRARVSLQLGDPALARAAAQAATDAFQQAKDALGQAEARLLLGVLAARAGEAPVARRALHGAARLAESCGEHPVAAQAWLRLAEVLRRSGDGDGALGAAVSAERAAARAGDRLAQARAGRARGDAARALGRHADARAAYATAARAFQAGGDEFQRGICLSQLGRLAWRAGELPVAQAAFSQAVAALEPYDDPVRLALLGVYQAHVALQVGDRDGFEAHLARALATEAAHPQQGRAWKRAVGALAGALPAEDPRRARLQERAV